MSLKKRFPLCTYSNILTDSKADGRTNNANDPFCIIVNSKNYLRHEGTLKIERENYGMDCSTIRNDVSDNVIVP